MTGQNQREIYSNDLVKSTGVGGKEPAGVSGYFKAAPKGTGV